jgi:hexosaminidase
MRTYPIVPYPANLTPKPGNFTLTPETRLTADGNEAQAIAFRFIAQFARASGFALPVQHQARHGEAVISLKLDAGLEKLGKEGYTLKVTPRQAVVRAFAPAGLFYGMQSLCQLLPLEVYDRKPVQASWRIPCCEIEDKPRFGWRGAMMDCARHFFPKETVLRFIDLLARHKLNSFHWHLTEDQGWRIEIKKYPKLTEMGAWRKETIAGHLEDNWENPQYDGIPHGGYYTQADVREVVAYAAERFINVVPEIEMPGHSQAAIAAYPELGNSGEQLEVFTRWGVNENVFNVKESTVRFLQDVLDEVLGLFPSVYIHTGGDEVPKIQWRESAAAQKRIKELGLKDEQELQSWFTRRMDTYLTERGRRLVGWDEILEGGLAPNAVVMSWRGEQGGIEAANAGHDVVMAPTDYTYLDYYQAEPKSAEPLAIGTLLTLEKVYSYNPLPTTITPAQAHHVLGAQGQLWAEYIPNQEMLDYMAFPRLCALAEVTWTPAEKKDYAQFRKRMVVHARRLEKLGVNLRRLDKGE